MIFSMTSFQAAWKGLGDSEDVFGCPDCEMPVGRSMQKTNIRMEGQDRILSCSWCYRVFNIGPKDLLPLYC